MPAVSTTQPSVPRSPRRVGPPFFGAIDCVIVEDPVDFEFDGAVPRGHANAAWAWMTRDLGSGAVDPAAAADDAALQHGLENLLPELVERAKTALAAAGTSRETERRIITQLGGDEQWQHLPRIVNALKCRHLLDKAQAFGRATNGMQDDAALGAALQSMPLADRPLAALLMQAAVGQVANPSRLITAVIRITGAATEGAIVRAGFAPLVDAILAHAQNQIHSLIQVGPFADVDLACRAVDRFHRLSRAVHGYVELARNSRWSMIIAALTKNVSARVEPRLRDVVLDVNKALRKHREGTDRLDSDQLLTALSGVYLLATVRDARDSLAVNALFEQTWAQVGQALEIHIQRSLDILRQNPGDRITGERLDAAIKMAELRFNAEYADVLRRAKETAEKR